MSRELFASLLFVAGLFVIAAGFGVLFGVPAGVIAVGVAMSVVAWFLMPSGDPQ